MNRILTHRFLRWLLPILVARALVPVGFMLSADASGLALTFCSGVVTSAPGHLEAHHHDHGVADADPHQHHHGHHEASLCPFALVAGACSVHVPTFAVQVERSSPAPIPFESAPLSSLLLRAERIRGPPVVS